MATNRQKRRKPTAAEMAEARERQGMEAARRREPIGPCGARSLEGQEEEGGNEVKTRDPIVCNRDPVFVRNNEKSKNS